ncbi:hypothetical protein [Sphingobacterium sp.]|uniref:hypothetical protein n=1 Tax=Sphingobacterium sp. TaxID=341027 RepID=UPI002FDE57B4
MNNLKTVEEIEKHFGDDLKKSQKQYSVKAIKDGDKFYVMECIVQSYDSNSGYGYVDMMGFTFVNGEKENSVLKDFQFNFQNGDIEDLVENELRLYIADHS